jgi:hypothetical protein
MTAEDNRCEDGDSEIDPGTTVSYPNANYVGFLATEAKLAMYFKNQANEQVPNSVHQGAVNVNPG